MPPRARRRGNQQAAAAAAQQNQQQNNQQQNQPAADAAAPAIRGEKLLPRDMPLFSAGRSRDQFWNTLTAAEYKKVPATVMRKASVLAVNVWDVCGRKKTSRPNYEMPPVIMRTIMSFIGDKLEDGARYDPRVSGAALKAHAEAAQQKICDEILQNLSKFLTPYAMRGYKFYWVGVADIFGGPKTSARWAAPDAMTTANVSSESDWAWLFDYLTPLRATLSNAGYSMAPAPVLRNHNDDSGDDEEAASGSDAAPKKIWMLKFSWAS